MIRGLMIAALGLLLAACGTLETATGMRDPFATPQPFRGTGDPNLVGGVLGERAVYVGAIAGLDPVSELTMRKAIATNAAALDVLASAEAMPAGALILTGKAATGSVDFTLADGEASLATFNAAGDPTLIAVGAARALAQSLGRLGAPPPAAPTTPGVAAKATVEAPAAYIREVIAPKQTLADPLQRAVTQALADMGVRMKTEAAPDAYVLTAALTIGEDKQGMSAVSIVWKVFSPDGRDLGNAAQDNTVPTESVQGGWGETAALAGQAAAQSIVQMIADDYNRQNGQGGS